MNNHHNHLLALIESRDFIPSTTLIKQVLAYFKIHDRAFIAVVDEKKPAGLIRRDTLLRQVRRRVIGFKQMKQPVSVFMDTTPLVFEGSTITELFSRVVSRPIETFHDDVVISINGAFAGLLSIKKLMEYVLKELQSQVEQRPSLTKPLVATLFNAREESDAPTDESRPHPQTPSQKHTERVSLQGHLEAFNIVDLMQMLIHGNKTGSLTIRGPKKEGECFSVYFNHGKIIHAKGRGEQGKTALWNAMKIAEGEFVFHSDLQQPMQSIYEEPMFLLIEACRLQDEAAIGLMSGS
jgi:CBS domain-containing protein